MVEQIIKRHHRVQVTLDSGVHLCEVCPLMPNENKTLFVFSHGFTGYGVESDRIFIDVSNALARLGYPSLLFDYRGSGYSDLGFEDVTFDTELTDLNKVIDFGKNLYPGFKIALWGVSLGSAVSAVVASRRSDVKLMILWCLSADLYNRYLKRLGSGIFEKGFTYDKGFKVKLDFLESLKNHDVFEAIKQSEIPCLLVHGNADTVASIELSRTAHRIAPDNTYLFEIEGGNHVFSSQPNLSKEATRVTLDWLNGQTNSL